jgi:hypothetical protein
MYCAEKPAAIGFRESIIDDEAAIVDTQHHNLIVRRFTFLWMSIPFMLPSYVFCDKASFRPLGLTWKIGPPLGRWSARISSNVPTFRSVYSPPPPPSKRTYSIGSDVNWRCTSALSVNACRNLLNSCDGHEILAFAASVTVIG